MSKAVHRCNFCNQLIDSLVSENLLIISEYGEYSICEKCVKSANKTIRSAKNALNSNKTEVVLSNITPKNIKSELDKWIIGQDVAKRRMAIATYDHHKRISQNKDDEVLIQKSNILLVGSTGCGKTALIKALAKQLALPLHIQDVTTLSSVGYQGGNVEDILVNLLSATDGDLEKAQKGIVLLDEGDKLRKATDSDSGNRDVKGKGVQEALLKLTESGVYKVDYKNKSYRFDTENVLFVLAGAFDGIEKIIDKRMNKSTVSAGFNGVVKKKGEVNYSKSVIEITPEDLKKYGMMPELLGRFPIITPLQELTTEALVSILTEPKDAILKQVEKNFALDNVKVEYTEGALKTIAKKAIERKVGARALRSVVEDVLEDAKYECPNSNITTVTINDDLSLSYKKEERREN